MLNTHKLTVKTKNKRCCLLPLLHHHVYPIESENNSDVLSLNSPDEAQERRKVEAYVFSKLEEYSKSKRTFFRLTSFSRISRRLKSDIKPIARQFNSNIVSEEKILQWIDETLEQINSHITKLRSLLQSQDKLEEFLTTDQFISLTNTDNQWNELQLQRAKQVLSNNADENEEDLLVCYQNYIIRKLTPETLQGDRIPLKNQQRINLDEEYRKAETIGHEYLKNMFEDYSKRQHPDIELLKEMIHLGMEQMIKRPKTGELRQASISSDILTKATFILKSKRSYRMSLRNLADDFMLLRFGRSLDNQHNTEDSISNRFISLIHMFLNSISLLIYLIKSNSSDSFSSSSLFSPFNSDLSTEYILSPMIYINEWTWLLEKWKIALQTFPINLTNQGAFSRLVRTTIGVGIARLYGFAENNEQDGLDKKMFQALQMGFYYGIAYALVDGLQDNETTGQEQIHIDQWFEKMEQILCGDKLDPSSLPKSPITPLLLETFHSLIQLTSNNGITQQIFTDLALLLRSQRSDKKDLERSDYNNIDLFIGSLLKSHFTYSATAFMGGAKLNENHQRLWVMPFLGQLTDDCRDFNEDRVTKSITPVTYYAQHHGSSFNPFNVFLFICEDLYLESNRSKNTGAFLGRRILRTLRALGNDLKEFLQIFTLISNPKLYKYILSLEDVFTYISDPEKRIFHYVNIFAKKYSLNHRTLETFAYDSLPLIEKQLAINIQNNNSLIQGMNHSLRAGGKRLRPLLLLMISQIYNIDIQRVLPLARAIEYLHTSSLILDDLPAQDNAPLRRGHPTLHMAIDSDDNDIPISLAEGRAQLAAVNLIAHAIRLVTVDLSKEGFSSEIINQITAELAQSMDELCYGQFLDLQAARTKRLLTINELDRIAELKTGKAIEIVLVCPIILAGQDQSFDQLRELGRLMGILFQMKDDLLDVEGHTNELGKLKNIDQLNETRTYVNLLGIKKTRERILIIRKQIESILNQLWPQAGTIRDVIRYICERQK